MNCGSTKYGTIRIGIILTSNIIKMYRFPGRENVVRC